MELAGSPGDASAGYMVEDSDLEYSDCFSGERSAAQQDLSSEDEFEKEMAGEVMSAMKVMLSRAATRRGAGDRRIVGDAKAKPSDVSTSEGSASKSSSGHPQFYDQVYFDSSESSDEEEAVAGSSEDVPRRRRGRTSRKVKKLTNDELFYDPNMDDEDEKWMNRRRMAYHNVKVSQQLEQKKKARLSGQAPPRERNAEASAPPPPPALPKSDAVLNCPACMTTLCIDCQRHDVYPNQFRAMFVLNCRVVRDEVLKYVPKPSKKSRKRQRGNKAPETGGSSDPQEEDGSYHPVRCAECNTEIAVLDTDEVFHFFNVLPSAPG